MGGSWWVRWPMRLVIVLGTIIAADVLFYGVGRGYNVAIGSALLLAVVICSGVGRFRGRASKVLLGLHVGVMVALVEHPGPLPVLMSFLLLALLAVTMRHGWTFDVPTWITRGVAVGIRGIVQWLRDLRIVAIWCDARGARRPRLRSLRRWVPAAGLGLVFLTLFCVANPVLKSWVLDLTDHVFDLGHYVQARRVLFWFVTAVCVWALIRTRVRVFEDLLVPFAVSDRPLVSGGTVIRSLAVFNVLFAVQNALDMKHLWMGVRLPDGMTYAEYAQRGAYPLIASALLAAAFVLVAFRDSDDRDQRWSRRLVYVFLAQNVFLTVGAMLRLLRYVEVYSLTRLRVATMLWMGLVALGLLWIVVRIVRRRSNRWLLTANALSALGLIYCCCFFNWDRTIAEYNVDHCEELAGEGPPIDFDYLDVLGTDALPALIRLKNNVDEPALQLRVSAAIQRQRTKLDEQLSDWRTWTWRRSRLADE